MSVVVSALLLSLSGVLQASDLPNHFDEVVLLQRMFKTRPQHATTIFQEPLELTQDSMAETLDSIQDFLQNQPDGDDDGDVDSGDDGDGGGVSGGGGSEGLQAVRQMLESHMETYLMALHEAAEHDWQTATDLATACGTRRVRRFDNNTGDVTSAERAMHQARLKHHACRRSEKVWNSFHAMSYSPPTDLGVHNVDSAAIAFSQAVTSAQLLAQTYNTMAPAGTHECLVDQTSFEMSFCIWAAKATETCNAYTSCIAGVDLADLQSRLLVDSGARRTLWRTIGILKCRVDEMMTVGSSNEAAGINNSTDHCAEMAVSTYHLALALPLPPPDDCTDEQLPHLSPSAEDSAQCAVWMRSEYSWDSSDVVLPDACAATCLGVHPPQPPPDCEDASAQCEFYRQHPSACGSFPADGQALEACTDCCHCRFSPACGHCPPGYILHQGGTACRECPEGQIPNDDSTSCVDPQPCVASVDCSGHGTTSDLDKSDGCHCNCAGGFLGVDCSTPPPCDAVVDCSGHGATIDVDSTDGCDCACDEGFEGADCATSSIQGGLPPVGAFFDQTLTCTTVWSTRRSEGCPSPSAPPGWVHVLEYQDDECRRDIPDSPSVNTPLHSWQEGFDPTAVLGIQTWQEGFANDNAAFLGSDQLATLVASGAFSRGALCFKASREGCHGGCSVFDASDWLSTEAAAYGDLGLCGEYGDTSDLEKIFLFLAGACAHHAGSGSRLRVLGEDFSGPLGSDGKLLYACRIDSGGGPRFSAATGVSWRVHGAGLTLKNSDQTYGGFSVGDELAPMWGGGYCREMSSDAGPGIDTMSLYLGTAEAASIQQWSEAVFGDS